MADVTRSHNCTARQRAILTAIIESYIETGEPVGSGTIARLQVLDGGATFESPRRFATRWQSWPTRACWSSRIPPPAAFRRRGRFGCTWSS
jgi:hypothetical protein